MQAARTLCAGGAVNSENDPCPPGESETVTRSRLAGADAQRGESIVDHAARVAQGAELGDATVRRLAFLVFDSHDDIALVGSRSAALRPRRMLFQSDPAALDLELRTDRRGSHASMLGQVRGVELSSDASIRLQSASGSVEAAIDDQGWFEMDAVRVGSYSATLKLGRLSLEITSLVI
jgi:hypothetical protein